MIDFNDPPTIFPLVEKIKQQSGIIRTTTGKEPTHIVMNGYTYHRLVGELHAIAKISGEPQSTTTVNGLAIAVLPNDNSQEEKLEVL